MVVLGAALLQPKVIAWDFLCFQTDSVNHLQSTIDLAVTQMCQVLRRTWGEVSIYARSDDSNYFLRVLDSVTLKLPLSL